MSGSGSPAEGQRGRFGAAGVRVAILVARFNADVTERLLEGALACLRDHGAAEGDVEVHRVPGAWELPQAAWTVADRRHPDAIVALGCVIRGETPHFDYVCDEANRGLGEVARVSGIPVAFGVLTTENHEQAMVRAADGPTNKGYEATLAALEMVALYRSLDEE